MKNNIDFDARFDEAIEVCEVLSNVIQESTLDGPQVAMALIKFASFCIYGITTDKESAIKLSETVYQSIYESIDMLYSGEE